MKSVIIVGQMVVCLCWRRAGNQTSTPSARFRPTNPRHSLNEKNPPHTKQHNEANACRSPGQHTSMMSTLSMPLHSSSHTDLSHVLLDHHACRLVHHRRLHRHYFRNRCLRQHRSSHSYIRGVFGPPGATPLEPPYETRHRLFCFCF